jgi:hypothetical protein
VAVPTLSACAPNPLFTGGQFVTITGTGFQPAYPLPDINGPYPPPIPTVEVTFNGRLASEVRVESNTSLTCIAPAGDAADDGPAAATVVLKNLDIDGVPIAGEVVTSAAIASYARADLSVASDLQRITREFIHLLKQQVHPKVVRTTSSDFTDDAGKLEFNITDLAGPLPVIGLTGPALRRNLFYGEAGGETEQRGTNHVRRRYMRTSDLLFKVTAFDDSEARILNLQALLTDVFELNTYFELQRDPSDVSKGFVYYELDAGDFSDIGAPNNSDVRAIAGEITVRGFTFEDVASFPDSMVAAKGTEVDSIELQPTRTIPA